METHERIVMYYKDEGMVMYDIIKACVSNATPVKSSTRALVYAVHAMLKNGVPRPKIVAPPRARQTGIRVVVDAEKCVIGGMILGCLDTNKRLKPACAGVAWLLVRAHFMCKGINRTLVCEAKSTHRPPAKKCPVPEKVSLSRLHTEWHSLVQIGSAAAPLVSVKNLFVNGRFIGNGAQRFLSATITHVSIAARAAAMARKLSWKPITLSPFHLAPTSYCQWQMGGHYV